MTVVPLRPGRARAATVALVDPRRAALERSWSLMEKAQQRIDAMRVALSRDCSTDAELAGALNNACFDAGQCAQHASEAEREMRAIEKTVCHPLLRLKPMRQNKILTDRNPSVSRNG